MNLTLHRTCIDCATTFTAKVASGKPWPDKCERCTPKEASPSAQ